MRTQSGGCRRYIVVRVNSGEDLLQAIRAAVKEEGLRNGLIVSGVGSVNRYHVHVVGAPDLPPRDLFIQDNGPFDILSMAGMVIDGRVHAHATFSNTEKAMGGHLEEGCRVLTFAAVVLADTPELRLADWDQVGEL